MKLLQVVYSSNINHLGTRKYLVYQIENDVEKMIATIYSNKTDVREIAEEYAKTMREWEVILVYDEKDNDKRILIKEVD